MGLQPVRTTYSNGVPVWQGIQDELQGGATLDTTGLTLGTVIAAGRAIIVNEATRMATLTTADTDTPTGLLKEDVVVAVGADLAVITAGTVYARRIPALSSALKAKLPRITFSQSF